MHLVLSMVQMWNLSFFYLFAAAVMTLVGFESQTVGLAAGVLEMNEARLPALSVCQKD